MKNPETVLAVYASYETATQAVADLRAAGFDQNDISLAANRAASEYALTQEVDVSGAEGAGFGAAVGTVAGAVTGMAAIVIPGIGPILAAGPLIALLGGATGAIVGAAAGAVTGGLTASLVHIGVPSEYAGHYAESVRRGGALVTVTVRSDTQASNATEILRHHHPLDMDRRVKQWLDTGWHGFDPQAKPYTHDELERERESYPGETYSNPDDDTVRRYPHVR